jgi:hypothetical protein
LELEEE